MIIYIYGPLVGQDGKKQLKIGETQVSVAKRYAGNVSFDPNKVIKEIEVPKNKEAKSLDKQIHRHLSHMGFKKVSKKNTQDGRSTECFYTDEEFHEDRFIANINQFLGKLEVGDMKHLRTDDFAPRPEQDEAVDKAINYFTRTLDREKFFLFNAKPRFGKNYATFKLVKAMNWKKVLVLSHFPSTKLQWKDALLNHVDFQQYNEFIILDNRVSVDVDKLEERTVVYSSLQKLKNLNENDDWIYQVDWDLVVFDEIHYGEKTDLVKGILRKLNYQNQLGLSATPFNKLREDVITDDQQYIYTYVDEQIAKRKEEANPKLVQHHKENPNMDILLVELRDSALERLEYKSLFQIDKDDDTGETKFRNEETVKKVFTNLGKSEEADNPVSPFSNKDLLKISKTNPFVSMIYVGGADIRDNLAEVLKTLPEFVDFGILPLGDDAGNGIDALESTNKKIQDDIKNGKKGTILISVDKLTTGVTIPELTSIMVMAEGNSSQQYIQKIFRAQSVWTKGKRILKENCYIYDYSPENAARNIAGYLGGTNEEQQFLKDMVKYSSIYSTSTEIMRQDFNPDLTVRIPVDYRDLYEKARGIDTETVLLNKTNKSAVNWGKIIRSSNELDDNAKENIMEFLRLQELYAKNSNVKVDSPNTPGSIDSSPKVYKCKKCNGISTTKFPSVKNDDGSLTETCPICGHSETVSKASTPKKESHWFGYKEDEIQAILARFIQSIVIYVYLSELKEENIEDIIFTEKPNHLYKKEQELFTRVTGVTKEMFSDIHEHLWSTADLNDIITSIKRSEKNSINYLWPNLYGAVIYDKDFMSIHNYDIFHEDLYKFQLSYRENAKNLKTHYYDTVERSLDLQNSLDQSGILLKYLSNISNNIKFVSPDLAKLLADVIAPKDDYEFWGNPEHVYFDPFSTSGSILKEIASRVFNARTEKYRVEGRRMMPDVKRSIASEILNNQIWAIGQTPLMSDVTKRSIYGTDDALSPVSQLLIEDEGLDNILHSNQDEIDGDGNVWSWEPRKTVETKDTIKIVEEEIANSLADRHPFSFKKNDRTTEEQEFVEDVEERIKMLKQEGKKLFIVNNPPYYTDTSSGHYSRSSAPLYHEFLRLELLLEPDVLVTIQPSRLFNSGKGGPKKFLEEELLGKYIENIERVIDFENSENIFPGTDFGGGIHIMKYNKLHNGPTNWTFFDKHDKSLDGTTYLNDDGSLKTKLKDIVNSENTKIRYLNSVNDIHMGLEDILRDPIDFKNVEMLMSFGKEETDEEI